MKRWLVIGWGTLASLSLVCCGGASEERAEPAAAPAAAAAAEPASAPAGASVEDTGVSAADTPLTGVWKYTTSNRRVNGMCPAGSEFSGEAELTTNGDKFTFLFLSGATCKPQPTCEYGGTLSGSKLIGENSATVDSEGGKVVNTFELAVGSTTSVKGIAKSIYEHPGGMRCVWTYEIAMQR